jgi:uncharacterized membrane protein YjgN (DUF898 family)
MNDGEHGTGTTRTVRQGRPGTGSGDWEALPPDPGAPGASPRYRAPWATKPTAPLPAPPPRPAAADAPESGGGPASASGGPGKTAPARPTSASGSGAPLPLAFTGSAGEYFRVWIVNVCLTVLTLGIYSAWAKVRTKRYFYRHTRLDGTPFDYLAQPRQILKGQALVAVVFVGWQAAGALVPAVAPLLAVALLFGLPVIVYRALRFRAQNTAWRNIRFGFDGGYKDALMAFVAFPALTALTLGALYPYLRWRQKAYVVGNVRLGSSRFALGVTAGPFYKVYLRTALPALGLAVASIAPVFAVPLLAGRHPAGPGAAMVAAIAPVTILGALGSFALWAYVQAGITNLVWNHTTVGGHRFESTLRARDLAWLYVTNVLGIALSLGLLVPWSRVRLARYRAARFTALPGGDLGAFAAGERRKVGAAGVELGEALDLDLGFGL